MEHGKKSEVRKFEHKNIGAFPTSGTDRRELEGRWWTVLLSHPTQTGGVIGGIDGWNHPSYPINDADRWHIG
jgi:hypothetical protein